LAFSVDEDDLLIDLSRARAFGGCDERVKVDGLVVTGAFGDLCDVDAARAQRNDESQAQRLGADVLIVDTLEARGGDASLDDVADGLSGQALFLQVPVTVDAAQKWSVVIANAGAFEPAADSVGWVK
jgi:hypothetical protein